MDEKDCLKRPALAGGWERISWGTVFDTPVFRIARERSKCLRTGEATDFYYFLCRDWVNIIAETPDKNIVMITQHRHGSGQRELEIPGGCMDAKDRSPEEAAARELFEETGYAGDAGELIGSVCPNPALQGNLCHTVLIRNAVRKSAPAMEDTEDIETVLKPAEGIDKMILGGQIRHGLVLNALHFYSLRIRTV
jgi:ADP-ribose pyrophosphatase YjhB (NUDIX family)